MIDLHEHLAIVQPVLMPHTALLVCMVLISHQLDQHLLTYLSETAHEDAELLLAL